MFTEDLHLSLYPTGHAAARFVFQWTWTPDSRHRCQQTAVGSDGSLCNFETFPRAIAVLLERFKVHALRLQFSNGRWDQEGWGGEALSGSDYTPGGAEMWAQLSSEGGWDLWKGLRRALSGLYCASLDSLDETRVLQPAHMPMPGGPGPTNADMRGNEAERTAIFTGSLPREPVCTENLTPLVKLLPCRSKDGLGRLLHPSKIFGAAYHSLSVDARASWGEEGHCGASPQGTGRSHSRGGVVRTLSLTQTVFAVFRLPPRLPGAPRWAGVSLQSLLLPPLAPSAGAEGKATGQGADSLPAPPKGRLTACPLAARSSIHSARDGSSAETVFVRHLRPPSAAAVDAADEAPDGPGGVSLDTNPWEEPGERAAWRGGGAGAGAGADASPDDSTPAAAAAAACPLPQGSHGLVEHYLGGRGGLRGVSVTHLTNRHPTAPARVQYMEVVPYFMSPLFGTLTAEQASSPPCGGVSSEGASFSGTYAEAVGDAYMSFGVSERAGFSGTCAEGAGDPSYTSGQGASGFSLASDATLHLGEGRRPSLLEAALVVPPNATVVLGFEFFKNFLPAEDFPPDPSRGFDAPPPLARFSFDLWAGKGCRAPADRAGGDGGSGADTCRGSGGLDGADTRVLYVYGSSTLLDIPQPDFSMPFNVITFTSTVVTFFLGTAINLFVRRSSSVQQPGVPRR